LNVIRLLGRQTSGNVQKVIFCLEEIGVPYVREDYGRNFNGNTLTDAYRKLNPNSKVPTLIDGDVVIWESHTILRYLAARYGRGWFWSDDAGARSQVERWMDWSQTTLQPDFLMGVFWGFYRTPEPQRNWPAIRDKVARCARHFQLLDRMLADRPFLAGNALSPADIPAGTCLYRYFELDIERPSVPNVEAWYRRLQDRPAYRAHVMVPFGELSGRLDP
jgi:glutathione S-transferase